MGFNGSKCLFSIMLVMTCLILLNATSCSFSHFSFEALVFFVDSSGLRGAVISEILP